MLWIFVFGHDRSKLDSLRPNQKQTRDFVDELQAAIFKENKALSSDRGNALSKILVYNERPGTPCFAGIDPHVFAFQLALRVREPSLIDQKKLGVCGEAALMIAFAKSNPADFADYALSLMSLGSGRYYELIVQPQNRTAWKSYGGKIAEVDFVVIGSLLEVDFFGTLNDGSDFEGVCDRLSKAGFRNVHNAELAEDFDENPRKFLQTLRDAAQAVSAGKLVMIGVHYGAIKFLREKKISRALEVGHDQPAPSVVRRSGQDLEGNHGFDATKLPAKRARGNHWIAISRLDIEGDRVTIKLYSWQDTMQGTFLLKTFLSCYSGYVSAEPPKV
jgi:hypothetical protein